MKIGKRKSKLDINVYRPPLPKEIFVYQSTSYPQFVVSLSPWPREGQGRYVLVEEGEGQVVFRKKAEA